MSYYYGPSTVKNGLVLCLDAANPKSYISGSNTWRDISSSNLTGELVNGVGYSSTNKGSLTFDGTNDFVQIPDNPVFNFGSNDFTFNITVKPCKNDVVIYAQSNQGGYAPFLLLYNTSWTAFSYWASSTAYSWNILGTDLQTSGLLNVWTDLTLTRNGNVWTSYKDGQFVSSKTSAGTLYDSSDSMKIGARTGSYNNYTSGSISSVRIYNRALSASEVLQNYNATKGRYNL